jgi:hypothetical protein
MSNPLTPVDARALAAVTGGTASQRSIASNNDLLQTLNSLSSTLQGMGTAAKTSGFSTTEILMLGFLMTQNRNQINVFVRRPYW